MKKLLIIPFLFISLILSATNYYVKTGGSDGAAGTSDGTAWESITKVNSYMASFANGDSLLFKRGDTFYGTLNVTWSTNSIVFGAYGSGAQPIITGFTTITGWTNEGGGIYSKTISATGLNMVFVDGVNTAIGREPNSGWLTYESHSGTISITDNQLTNTPNWTGAEAVIRKHTSAWMLDRNPITNHSTHVITYTAGSDWVPYDGFGYFIQNALATLDVLGEWYYGGGKFYMYFGAVDPTTKTVKIATLSNLVTALRKYTTFCNIHFTGCNSHALDINTYGGTYTIKNCTIDFVGGDGIQISQDSGDQTTNFSITDNIISDINVTGINWLSSTLNHGTISGNIINNIGLMKGGGPLTYPCSDFWADGINIFGHDIVCEYNHLTNIGHIGIRFSNSDNVIVRKNVIDGVGLTRYDAGGIYCWNEEGYSHFYSGYNYSTQIENKIEDNIVLNGYAVNDGVAPLSELGIWGIYMDEYSIDLDVTRNTVENFPTSGIFLLSPVKDIRITYNTTYNCGAGFSTLGWTGKTITLNTVNNNKFIAKESTQRTGQFQDADFQFDHLGTLDYNYYARPIDDNTSIQTIIWTTPTNRTLAGWASYATQDAHSNKSLGGTVDNTDKLHFIYNDSAYIRQWTLSAGMKDVENTDYSGEIQVYPFTSLVLIGAGTVTPYYGEIDPPVIPAVSTGSPSGTNAISTNITSEVLDDGNGTLTHCGVCWSTSENPTTSDSHTTHIGAIGTFFDQITGLHGGITYHIRAYAINETGIGYGNDFSFTTPKYNIGMVNGKIGMVNGKIGIVH